MVKTRPRLSLGRVEIQKARAAQASSLFAAAEAYALLGFSVLPLIV